MEEIELKDNSAKEEMHYPAKKKHRLLQNSKRSKTKLLAFKIIKSNGTVEIMQFTQRILLEEDQQKIRLCVPCWYLISWVFNLNFFVIVKKLQNLRATNIKPRII